MPSPEFRFVPLAENDLAVLFEWLNRSHVAEWWDGPVSSDAVREKYLPRIGSTPFGPQMVFLGEAPVGFIQSYVAIEQATLRWPEESDPGLVGIDQFLADGDRLGKGVGTEMVSQYVRLLFQNTAVTRVQTDPAPSNLRAIRCYEKVGFQKIRVVETADGPALLMIINR